MTSFLRSVLRSTNSGVLHRTFHRRWVRPIPLHRSLLDRLRRVLVRVHIVHELSRQLVQQRRDDVLAGLVAQLVNLHELHHLHLSTHAHAHIPRHLTALERQLLPVAVQHLHEVEVAVAHAHDDD